MHDVSNCRNVSQLSLKLINRGLVGNLDERNPSKRLWRRVGHSNGRVYCYGAKGAADVDDSGVVTLLERERV